MNSRPAEGVNRTISPSTSYLPGDVGLAPATVLQQPDERERVPGRAIILHSFFLFYCYRLLRYYS